MEEDKKVRTESKQNKEKFFFNSSIFCPLPKNCDHCVEQERKNEPTLVLSICFKSNPSQSRPIVQMKDVFVASDQKKLAAVFYSSVAILVLFIFLSFDEVQQKFPSLKKRWQKTHMKIFFATFCYFFFHY